MLSASPACLALPARADDLLFTSTRDSVTSQLYRMAQDGSQIKRATVEPMVAAHIARPADGKRTAFVALRQGRHGLYLLDLATGQARQLTDDEAMESTPVWSPDGQQIVFQSYGDQTPASSTWTAPACAG